MMDDLLQEMIDPAPVHRDAPRRRRLWTTVAIVGLAAIGATALTTSAIFTDNDSASADIQTGTVDLSVNSPATFVFQPQALAPGDTTYAPLVVNSNGSLELRYSIAYKAEQIAATATAPTLLDPSGAPVASGGDLRTVLQLRMYEVPSTQCNDAGTGGLTTPSTPLNAAGTISPWPAVETPLVGSNAPGQQTGDRVMAAASAPVELCARVDFPQGPNDNAFQAAGVKLDLTFNAEQTAHNP